MTDPRHRKTIRAACQRATSLAADLRRRRGHMPDMTPADLDAFADGLRMIAIDLLAATPATVRAAKDAAMARSDAPWHARHAMTTILNAEAKTRGIDPYRKDDDG